MTSLRRCRWTKTGDRSSQIERTTGEMGLGRSIWTILWLTTINLPHRRKSPGYVRNLARTAALIREEFLRNSGGLCVDLVVVWMDLVVEIVLMIEFGY
ncbi:hypothetical protein QYF36_003840 [Acer negundo]|nr:hypothetical protein QYF36_003840 [Acer negundo]